MSSTALTRKERQSKSLQRVPWCSADLQPSVASQNCPAATSLATFAPMSTATSCFRSLRRRSEQRPSLPPSSSRPPLIRLTDTAPSFTGPMFSMVFGTNWCGNTQIRMSAFPTAFLMSGSAMTCRGRVTPGRYFTFSLVSLKWTESLRFTPLCSISSSNIQTVKSFSNSGCRSVFVAMMVAMAMPQLPLPTTVTLFGAMALLLLEMLVATNGWALG
mmetsp:Transcript_29337/g.47105  ORF Transcript_29337/g.47105 Transcript_29337/m.47105 type:complete len:216 (+) Transcript_29337:559-1206(+)